MEAAPDSCDLAWRLASFAIRFPKTVQDANAFERAQIVQAYAVIEASRAAVDKAIAASNRVGRRIGKRERALVHRILRDVH
jgi:hypothetical protein